MGSRAVVVVCRDEDVARGAFGIEGDGAGRRLHAHRAAASSTTREAAARAPARRASTGAGLWEELDTDWLCLDCELLPWSAKAMELIAPAYAAVGAAAPAALRAARSALEPPRRAALDVGDLLERAPRARAER